MFYDSLAKRVYCQGFKLWQTDSWDIASVLSLILHFSSLIVSENECLFTQQIIFIWYEFFFLSDVGLVFPSLRDVYTLGMFAI